MEQLQVLLEALLCEYFHIVPVRTQRRDQWYKRKYHSWKQQSDDRDLLILSSKQSKSEWAPRLSQFANYFATSLRDIASKGYEIRRLPNPPSDAKLFEDQVLDDGFVLNRSRGYGPQSLTPVMQRLSFWTSTTKSGSCKQREYSRAIQELLKRGQIQSLLYLVRQPSTKMVILNHSADWQAVVDDMLELFIFLTIIRCFSDNFAVDCGWKCWVPIVHCHSNSVVYQYLDSRRGIEVLTEEQQSNNDMERCFTTLCMTEVLWTECGLPALDWEKHIIDKFLSFTGFEIWNRMREGSSYLGCSLNTVRDKTWLQKDVSEAQRLHTTGHDLGENGRPTSMSDNAKDYSEQLSCRKYHSADLGEDRETYETLKKLAFLEAEEAEYGLKRSMKYRRKVAAATG